MPALDSVKEYIPLSGEGGLFTAEGAMTVVTGLILIAILAVALGTLTYFIMQRRKFNKKIIILEKVNGQYQPTSNDWAMNYKIGQGGDVVFFLKKNKKYLPMASLQTGVRTYWFAIREDNEWINIGIDDIDFEMRKIKAKFLDKEMRLSRVALQRNMRERFDKPGFWMKYGGLVAYIGLIAITGIMFWLLLDRAIGAIGDVESLLNTQTEVMELAKDVLAAIDGIKSGGTGYVPAG